MEEQADFKAYLNGLELKSKESILSAIRKKAIEQSALCPHCRSNNVVKNRTIKRTGNQRYMCRDCHKRFSATTGTILFALKKSAWFPQVTERS